MAFPPKPLHRKPSLKQTFFLIFFFSFFDGILNNLFEHIMCYRLREKILNLPAPDGVAKWVHDYVYGHPMKQLQKGISTWERKGKVEVKYDLEEAVDQRETLFAARKYALDHWSQNKRFIKTIRKLLREHKCTTTEYVEGDFNGQESPWYYKEDDLGVEEFDCEEYIFWRYLFEKCYDVFEKEGVPPMDEHQDDEPSPVPKKKARTSEK